LLLKLAVYGLFNGEEKMRIITWCSVIFLISCYIILPIQDPDLGWHITVGRWILANHTVPNVDLWNMFAVGTPWVAYSWSSEVIFALVDKIAGVSGLFAFKFIMVLLLIVSLFYCYGKVAKDWFVGGLLGILSGVSTYNHLTLRPQMILWLFFVWLLYLLHSIEKNGATWKKKVALILIFSVWANTHLSAALGIMTVVLWLWGNNRFLSVIKTTILALVGTLLTPYCGKEWLVFFNKTEHPFQMNVIAEFNSATILQYSTGFLVISVVLLLYFLHFKPTLISYGKSLLCMLFVGGALAVLKFIPMAVIVLCACVAECWANSAENRDKFAGMPIFIEKLRSFYNYLPPAGFSFFCLCLATVYFVPKWQQKEEFAANPMPSIQFIKENNLPHPIMNGFGQGGSLMYSFSDEKGNLVHKVAIDGRTNVNPSHVWQAFMAANQFKYNWQDYFKLVKPETILWKTESPLTTYLLESDDWCRVHTLGAKNSYKERGFSVFVKADYQKSHKLASDDCK